MPQSGINFGFWKKLKEQAAKEGRPILVLAPMADVTDPAFRRIIAARGKPDVLWTEFVSADGLARAPEPGRGKLMRDLLFTPGEHPIVAQFFTATPEHMRQAAELAARLGFDGVDINMGCPDKAVERQGAGAALTKTPALARELIRSAQNYGFGPVKNRCLTLSRKLAPVLPVSVKTRLGWSKNEIETWLPELLAEKPAVITLHARTRKEMSKVPAHWDQVKRAVEIRDEVQKDLPAGERTLIFGNGDVLTIADAKAKAAATGADGIMLGKAIFGNPWLFSNISLGREPATVTVQEKLKTLAEHVQIFTELLGDVKSFAIMKKHFKAYISGWEGAAELRARLMDAVSPEEVINLLTKSGAGI